MNDPKMPYFTELIFAGDGFKRDFAELVFADARADLWYNIIITIFH